MVKPVKSKQMIICLLIIVIMSLASGCGAKKENTTFKIGNGDVTQTVKVEIDDGDYKLNRDGSLFSVSDSKGTVLTQGYFSDQRSYDTYKATSEENPSYQEITVNDNNGFFVEEGQQKWVHVISIKDTGTCVVLTNTVSAELADKVANALRFV
jgi:hypothetical protein